jgi:PAS domain S-box-containing protein
MHEDTPGPAEHWTHHHHLEVLDRVHHAIRHAGRLEKMLADVQDLLLEVFSCDRAWLLYPCDPASPVFRVPMERTRPAWPGAKELGRDVRLDAETRQSFASALAHDRPLRFDSKPGEPNLGGEVFARFHVQAQMTVALHPEVGPAWLLGIHHCGREHRFSEPEVTLFDAIGRRISDALSTLLTLKNLRESENRSRALVECAPDAILLLDTKSGHFVEANGSASKLFGLPRERLLEIGFSEIDPSADDLAAGIRAALAGEQTDVEWRFVDPTRGEIPCEVRLSAFPTEDGALIRCAVSDISARKRDEEQRRQSQKLEVVGLLAGGVAHDFNNLLTVISGHAEILSLDETADPEDVQAIISAAQQAAALTRHLLSFSRGAVSQPRIVDVNAVLSSSGPLLQRLIGERHQLDFRPGAGLDGTLIDPSQLQQIVMNLVLNARDSMEGGGEIVVKTAAIHSPSDLEGPCIELSVRDHGIGMSEEVQGHIFEPFFTTKALGKGTGLGLPTVLDIVRSRGGALEVASEEGHGTCISVYLVTCEGGLPREADAGGDPSKTYRGRGEQILLVEDEQRIRELCANVLERAGYRVEALDRADEALALFEADPERFALLVSDVVMPGMSGIELAKRMTTLRPAFRVLCVSGYAPESEVQGALANGDIEFLPKPFSPGDILRRVHELLVELG